MYIKILPLLIILFIAVKTQTLNSQWVPLGPVGGHVSSLANSDGYLYAGTDGGLYRTTDNGISWFHTLLGIERSISVITTNGSQIFASTYDLPYFSTDYGQTWVQCAEPGAQYDILSAYITGGNLIIGKRQEGVFVSTNNGLEWHQSSMTVQSVSSFASSGNIIYCGAISNLNNSAGVYKSTDNGISWQLTSLNNKFIYSIAAQGSNVYAGSNTGGVYISNDNGISWAQSSLNNQFINTLEISGSDIWAGTNTGLYMSTNAGLNWDFKDFSGRQVVPLTTNGTNIYTNVNSISYHSSNNGLSWSTLPLKCKSISSFTALNGKMYASDYYSGVMTSTDDGFSWTQSTLGGIIWTFANNGSTVFAGASSGGMYSSTNNGASWSVSISISQGIYAIASNGSTWFAGAGIGSSPSVYRSTNGGLNWVSSLSSTGVFAITSNSSYVFAAARWGVIYRSSNNGVSWTQTSQVPNSYVTYTMISNGSRLIAGNYQTTGGGVYYSDDNALTWTPSGLINKNIWSLTAFGTAVFAASDSGVYRSTDNGISWGPINEGMESYGVRALYIKDSYLYAGALGGSVWRRPIDELVGVNITQNWIPDKFSLSQNYPNPFNPTTNIEFQIAKSGFVNLIIYDAMGREVESLVNEALKPGTYKADWVAAKYPSGVYLYKLTSGKFTQTKKMILIK